MKKPNLVGIGVATVAVLFFLLCMGVLRFGSECHNATLWVTHTTEVLDRIRNTRLTLNQPPKLLQDRRSAQIQVTAALQQVDRIGQLTRDNPVQQHNLSQLRALLSAPDAMMPNGSFDAGARAGGDAILGIMEQEEYRLLCLRSAAQAAAISRMAIAATGLCTALFLVGLVTGTAAWRQIRRRKQIECDLLREKDEHARFARKLAIVSAGTELIQAAQNEAMVDQAVVQIMRDLLPDTGGYFALVSNSKDVVEVRGSWGMNNPPGSFVPSACLALQMGRTIHPGDSPTHMICPHATGTEGTLDSLCIPIRNSSECMGVLFVQSGQLVSKQRIDALTVLVSHLALGLTNLRMREALRSQSVRDALTGIYNRRYFDETLQRELLASARHGVPLSLLMFDVDHFKMFNDTHGHQAGDESLKALARIMRSAFRGSDVICRYGGEEFAIILIGTDLQNAHAKADSFRRTVAESELSYGGRDLGRMTVSIGVASSDEFRKPDALVRAADTALYQAKRSGRNAALVCTNREFALPSVDSSRGRNSNPLEPRITKLSNTLVMPAPSRSISTQQ